MTPQVSDCCNYPTQSCGSLLWVPNTPGGVFCSKCHFSCNPVFPPSPTQEEWDLALEMSRKVLETFMESIVGVHLCPAHAQKIIQLCGDNAMNDFPKNSGRLDA